MFLPPGWFWSRLCLVRIPLDHPHRTADLTASCRALNEVHLNFEDDDS